MSTTKYFIYNINTFTDFVCYVEGNRFELLCHDVLCALIIHTHSTLIPDTINIDNIINIYYIINIV